MARLDVADATAADVSDRVVDAVAAPDPNLTLFPLAEDQPGQADRALAAYGLARGDCVRVRSNLDADAIRACRLVRLQRPPSRVASRSSPPSPTLMAIPASASSVRAANMRGISSR